MAFRIKSPAFDDNLPIPRRFTGDGEDISPALEWTGAPEGTVELALVVDDPDAPREEPFVHWLAYGIPASTTSLPEGAGSEGGGVLLQGRNDFGKEAYGGPAPPEGHGVHRYHFHLYALGKKLGLTRGATKPSLVEAMRDSILAAARVTGTYERGTRASEASKVRGEGARPRPDARKVQG